MLRFNGSTEVMPGVPSFIARVQNQCSPDQKYALVASEACRQDNRLQYSVYEDSEKMMDASLDPDFRYLKEGDIVKIMPAVGKVKTLYRSGAKSNVIFATERCNSFCLMCSQPPRQVQDDYLVDDYVQAMKLMHPPPREMGISGGEPTLLGNKFLHVVEQCKLIMPRTALHILTNGRLFRFSSLAQSFSRVMPDDTMLGIPLYSDLAERHDYIVQTKDAFSETVLGLLACEQHSIPVEIRVVLHAETIPTLVDLARFIGLNLPFVKQVSFMGLERMGFAKTNFSALWIDPVDYADVLAQAVEELCIHSIKPLIFNSQLCTLPRSLWAFCRQSISDWKREYLPPCQDCAEKESCGGFFSSGVRHVSRGIAPIRASSC